MASRVYNNAAELFALGDIDWVNDDIRVLLVTSSYTHVDTHDFVNDITNELSGGNYVRKTLANKTVTQNDTDDWVELDADNVTWAALALAAGTPARAIVYKFVTNDTDSPLIGSIEFTSPPTPNGGDWTAKWNNGSSAGTLFRHAIT